MKILLLCAFLFMACTSSNNQQTMKAENNAPKQEANTSIYYPQFVGELFTSQGCSSCPPADKLLKEFDKQHDDFLLLSFHVDYWDYIGWKDVFSQAIFSNRQRDYGRHFRLNSVYTPQIIINGREEFVGSYGHVLNEVYANKSSAIAQNNKLAIDGIKRTEGSLVVKYAADFKQTNGSTLNFALLTVDETVYIRRGENKDRKLTYHNIVRYFKTQNAQNEGELSFDSLSNPVDLLVIYAQNHDRVITDCVVVDLNK